MHKEQETMAGGSRSGNGKPTGSRITAVERQKKNFARYNIYVDGAFAFAVHEDILIKYRLIKGREVDPEEIKEILEAEERSRAEQYALRYLNHRPRTAAEVHSFLVGKGFAEKDVEAIIVHCIEKGYINDSSYARQWIEERKRLKPRGRYLLQQELLQRGLSEREIDLALKENLADPEEREMIERLIRKRGNGMRFDSVYEMKRKMVPFLQRKGFPFDSILSVIEKIKREFVGDQEKEK